MRIRTISEAAKWVQQTDPDSALTPTAIRRLVISGELPSRRVGNKYLLDLESLERYMAGDVVSAPKHSTGYGEIRPV